MSDKKLLPNVFARSLSLISRDGTGATCKSIFLFYILVTIVRFDLGDLTASPWGDSVGGPLRALLEKVDAEVGEARDCEFDLFKRTKTP